MQSQPNIDITSPVEAQAAFDPPVIRPGETATYRVSFNAMQPSIQWLEDIIAPAALNLRATVRGQMFRPGGTNLIPQTTFNYRAHPTNTGTFAVPRYLIYVSGHPVTVPGAQLEVSATAPPAAMPRLAIITGATNPFVGQTLKVRAQLPGTDGGILQTLTAVQLNGDGFIMDPTTVRQQVITIQQNGREVPAFIYETSLTPLRPGRLEVTAQAHTAGLQFSGPIVISGRVTIPGGAGQFTLLDSDPLALQVRPLPREGELPGFTGAVGVFKLDPPTLSTNTIRVGEPVTLTVTVRGEGNLPRLVPPPLPRLRDWQIFAGRPDNAPPQLIAARGFATFQFTLIPNSDTLKQTPVIPFSFFNPDTGTYADLSLPARPISIRPGTAPPDAAALVERTGGSPDEEERLKLSAAATNAGRALGSLVPHQQRGWFPAAQFAPVLLFIALWAWDRQRRFHAAHPEIRRRRQARKTMRREWAALRHAAALGDTARFAACAVNALRAACAPHYPAEPRALVSRDVLPLLDETERAGAGAESVRKIFAATDASRFAVAAPEAKNLLALRTDLERVLTQLEAKLRA